MFECVVYGEREHCGERSNPAHELIQAKLVTILHVYIYIYVVHESS